jgi:hypothetical protein
MQLALRPLTRDEWQPALDKILACLPAWQSGMITREGRLLLINAVIAARPLHLFLIAEAPAWFLEEINRWARAFFWKAKDKVHGGECLVAWSTVCKPKEYGGLGVKDLALQGLALRVRWEWLRRTDPSRPWQGLPVLHDDMATSVFDSLVQIKVGKGSKVYFWKDRWLNGRAVGDFAPKMLQLVSTHRRNSRTVEVALIHHKWVEDIAGDLSHEASVECVRLWALIVDFGLRRNADDEDAFSWPCSPTGLYSASSTYNRLQIGSIDFAAADALWGNGAPVKCKIFMWLAILDRQWTSARRHRRGLQDQTASCYVCLQGEDAMDHLFTQCVHARQVWFLCFSAMGIAADLPTQQCKLEEWWLRERNKFSVKTRKNLDALIILGCWSLWKNRNAWVFNNQSQQFSVMELATRIRDEFSAWTLGRRGVTGVFDPF